ncbi:MAG: hypothetical protein R3D32_13655 [Nitratireductor sp.]
MIFSKSSNHFWDSCVLIRYLTQNPPELLGDMAKILDEAKVGKRKIWISTILFAEFRPNLLSTNTRINSISDLVTEMEGVLIPVAPNMDITLRAGRMRRHSFYKPDGERQHNEKKRVLSVPDAIQLATCLFVKEALGINDIEFHTFDDGRGSNYEEKAVSLLRLADYAKHIDACADIEAVRNLIRIRPQLDNSSFI